MLDKHLVIVLGLYFPGIDIIKNFTKRHIPCIGIDFLPHAPGFNLGKVKTYLCPDPLLSERDWMIFMINTCQKLVKRKKRNSYEKKFLGIPKKSKNIQKIKAWFRNFTVRK